MAKDHSKAEREVWARDLLTQLGLPHHEDNVGVLAAWIDAEGGDVANNPLNATLPLDGSTGEPGEPQRYVSRQSGS